MVYRNARARAALAIRSFAYLRCVFIGTYRGGSFHVMGRVVLCGRPALALRRLFNKLSDSLACKGVLVKRTLFQKRSNFASRQRYRSLRLTAGPRRWEFGNRTPRTKSVEFPSTCLLFRQAQVEIEEFDSPTLRAAKNVEREHAFCHIGPLTQEEMPSATCAARTYRQLPQSLHWRVTHVALRRVLLPFMVGPLIHPADCRDFL